MNTVTFPNLGLEFHLNNTAFELFGLEIRWYAVIIATGFLCALIFALTRCKEFGVDFDHMFDPVFWGVIAAVIGARAYFVIFHFDLYQDNLWEIFNIRGGGLAIYGGIIGGLSVGALVCKIKKIPALPLVDMAAIGFLIGQGFGRWGNFMNVEAYGAATSPDFLFGMGSPKIANEMVAITGSYDPNILVHPCFLYESVWCLLGAIILLFYHKHRKFDGELTLLYLLWYGAERAVVEGLRTDSLYIGETNIRVSQLLSAILVPVSLGLLIFFYLRTAKRKKTDPAFIPLYRDTEASRLLLNETRQKIEAEKKRKIEKRAKRAIIEEPVEKIICEDKKEEESVNSEESVQNLEENA